MADVPPGLLAEQERLRPMLDRLLALAALWADPVTGRQDVAVDPVATEGVAVGRARTPETVGIEGRSATIDSLPADITSSPNIEPAAASLPFPNEPMAPGSANARVPSVSRAGKLREPAQRATRSSGNLESPSGVAAPPPAWPVARLPTPRGRTASALTTQSPRTPFSTLVAAAAPSAPLADSPTRNAASPAIAAAVAATVAHGPMMRVPAAPDAMGRDAAPTLRRVAGGAGGVVAGAASASGAIGGIGLGGFSRDFAIDPALLPGDALEERLADLLERAALEAGVALP